MIARTWRGATRAEDAEAYVEYLHQTGFREFRETPGNLGAFGLRRIVDGRAVFLIVSLWESEDAIRRFAGDDVERAVFFPEDDRFLVEREERVEHYEVVHRGAGCETPGAGGEQTETGSTTGQAR
jgi:heme-degrading monooxygenase HmoA